MYLEVQHRTILIPSQRLWYRYAKQWRHLCYEVAHDVRDEEREEEPTWYVAIELARLPDMFYLDLLAQRIVWIEDKPHKEEIEDIANESPHEVWHNELFELLFAELTRITTHSLIEISCLEEEEGHEEI